MQIGEIINGYCQAHGLSFRQYALKCGVTNGYISMLINGANPKTGKPLRPTVETYAKLAAGMDMSINELFDVMDDAPVSLAGPDAPAGEDPAEVELVGIYRGLNALGQEMLLRTARSLGKDSEYKKGGKSSKKMV